MERDASWRVIRKIHENEAIFCNACLAMGLHDDRTRAPCWRCAPYPSPGDPESDIPGYARQALAVQMEKWWADNNAARTIFMVSPHFTISTNIQGFELRLTQFRAYYPERKEVERYLPGLSARRDRVVSKHERAHWYLKRAEDCYARCLEELGIKPGTEDSLFPISNSRINFFIYSSKVEEDAWVERHNGVSIHRGTELAALSDQGGANPQGDDLLFNRFLHKVAEHFIDRLYGGQREDDIPGWLMEGFPHHIEMLTFGEPAFYCEGEVKVSGSWTASRWRQKTLHAVKKGEVAFASLLASGFQKMDFKDHYLGWSLCDFLTTYDKKKFGKLLQELCAGKRINDALRESHHWTTNMLEITWIQYVSRAYVHEPKKPKPRR